MQMPVLLQLKKMFDVERLALKFLASCKKLGKRSYSAPCGTQVKWFKHDGTKVPGLKFGRDTNPGVIVLQEWWGITDEIKLQASYIAEKGKFCTLVPDLYRGKIGLDAEEANHLMKNLDWEKAIDDICAAADFLKENCRSKIGITGFCMGGALTLAAGVRCKNLDCGSSFYGVCPRGLADLSSLRIPIQAHFGDKDNLEGFSDPKTREDLEKDLKKSGVEYEIFRYSNVGHAFMNDTLLSIKRKKDLGHIEGDSGAVHDPEAIQLAYKRLFSFLNKHLR